MADTPFDSIEGALRLVDYKLKQLAGHLTASGRILNDLRMLRRLLIGDRDVAAPSKTLLNR